MQKLDITIASQEKYEDSTTLGESLSITYPLRGAVSHVPIHLTIRILEVQNAVFVTQCTIVRLAIG